MAKKSNPIHNEMKSLLASHNMTLTDVVETMNLKHPERKRTTVQNISNKLIRGTIKFSEIIEICSIIGEMNLDIKRFLINK